MAYTTINNPELHHQTKIYTGNGSSGTAITLDGDEDMQPDWIWIKARAGTQGAQSHNLFDSVRGEGKYLFSDGNDAESTDTNRLTSFDSDGFTVGSNNAANASSTTYVAWNWKAGGSASSNSNGNITSSVSANTTAGFSIVSYTGNETSGATIGHGLGVVPSMIMAKRRNSANNWGVYHQATGNTHGLYLDTNSAKVDSTAFWNDTTPTSTVFTLGDSATVNGSSDTYIAYCFSDIKGYSKFGSYTGNDNANGTFIYTGFAPAWVMIKRTNSVNDWIILDTKRNPINPSDERLLANSSNTASTANTMVDFLSNGFKPRSTYGGINGASDNFIYMAFAESPFVNQNGVPNNGR